MRTGSLLCVFCKLLCWRHCISTVHITAPKYRKQQQGWFVQACAYPGKQARSVTGVVVT
jgi:hypothetical protein